VSALHIEESLGVQPGEKRDRRDGPQKEHSRDGKHDEKTETRAGDHDERQRPAPTGTRAGEKKTSITGNSAL